MEQKDLITLLFYFLNCFRCGNTNLLLKATNVLGG